MFIDIHVHKRKVPGFPRGGKQSFSTPDQLIGRYDQIGIEKGVLLPGCNPECNGKKGQTLFEVYMLLYANC